MADRLMTDRERSIADFMYGFGLGDQHAHTEEEYYEMLVECSRCAPEDTQAATIERMRGLLGEALPELELSRNRYHNTSRNPQRRAVHELMARIDAELKGDGDG